MNAEDLFTTNLVSHLPRMADTARPLAREAGVEQAGRRAKLGNMPVFPLTDWRVAQLRLTAFPVIAERRQDLNWWSAVMEQEPEVRTVKTSPAQIEISGPFHAGVSRLLLSVTPLRTDWILAPVPTAAIAADTIGDFPTVLHEFLERMRRWFQLGQDERFPVVRLALGVVLMHPVDSREVGYARIGAYLSHTLHLDSATASDLSLQINRFVPSSVLEGSIVNRVNKWAVLAIKLLVAGDTQPLPGGVDSWSNFLELDLNTAADRREPLPEDRRFDILAELASHAEAIAADGDGA